MARYYELSTPPRELAEDLGTGGRRVAALLDALTTHVPPASEHVPPAGARPRPEAGSGVPGGVPGEVAGLPVRLVREAPATLLDRVDPGWLVWLESRRSDARGRLVDAGREDRLDLAEHVAMLVATPRLHPADPGDADALTQSGAILWLLGTLVATSLADDRDDALADLIMHGWWPIGPLDGSFLIAPLDLPRRSRHA
ncbi:hypothetical protein GCM10010156_19830 [Planobispora rosea]|uniref:Uncharacterized protein n=1 Tax=Planobispora rosea TaxID=35762 RepID=A0A8J3RYY5_PLARO|nr:hypothetical protein [Planobispora rosea]GGS61103.1 hypothetical protein GCM10010156_19830 [Planobispora rosea]GIH83918.1 hypothetical protein Pro02_23260 [Planobispora rosea]